MSDLQESLLNSFEILAKNYVQQAPGTIVIEAIVHQVINAGTGQYVINYLDNLMEVYANNPNVQFNIGDKVYVLIPNGDFSKQKIIISMSTPSTMIYDSADIDRYMEVSDNLFNNINEIQLSTYKTEEFSFIDDSNEEKKYFSSFSNLFPKYLQNYNTFLFSMDIKTSIKTEQQVNGNYGVKLQLPFYFYNSKKEKIPTWKTYILDVNNISGNPYRLTEWAKQNIFIQLSSEEKYDNDRSPQLTVFVKDFAQNDNLQDIKDIKIKNISFNVYDVLSEEYQQGYYLHLKASAGNYFFGGDEEEIKILTPTLKANGRNVRLNTSVESVENAYQCYWFKEDASIKEDSELYVSVGGIGWRCLNNKTNIVTNMDGTNSFEFVTNQYEHQIKAKDILTSARYKCVIVIVKQINEEKQYTTTVSKILKIDNLKASVSMSIASITGSNSYIKNIGEVGLSCTIVDKDKDFFKNYSNYSLSYEWNRYDKNNRYLDNNFYEIKINTNEENDTEQIIYQQISLKTSLIEDVNIFTCSAYINYVDKNTQLYMKQLLGTQSILINTNGTTMYNLSIQNGDVLYKYDTDGDSPLSEKYDGPLDTKVVMIKPLSYTIYKSDGTEFTDSEYAYCKTTWLIPKQSLITPMLINGELEEYDENYNKYEDIGKFDLNYTLASKYNFKKDNNVIILKVTYGDIELKTEASIKILKEGENGTNNSKYSAIITHKDFAYGEINKDGISQRLQAIYCVDQKQWYYHNLQNNTLEPFSTTSATMQKLELKLYNTIEEINIENNQENIQIEWSLFDSESNNPCINIVSSNGEKSCGIGPHIEWKEQKDIFVNIIQAKIIITENNNEIPEDFQYNAPIIELYAYYPIDIIRVLNLDDIEKQDINKTDDQKIRTIPTLTGGFSSVLYSSDGTNPQYNSSEPFTCIDSIHNHIEYKDNYIYEWNSSSNLKLNKLQEVSYYQINARPIAKYDAFNSQNYITVQLTLNTEKMQEAKNEMDNAQNEYYQNLALIESLNKNEEYLKKFLQEIVTKQELIFLLKNAKSYLQLKAKTLNSINELVSRYNLFLEYYQTIKKNIDIFNNYINYNDNNFLPMLQKEIRADDVENNINIENNNIIINNNNISLINLDKTTIINTLTKYQVENALSIGSVLYNFIVNYNEQFQDTYKNLNMYINADKQNFKELKSKYKSIIETIDDLKKDYFINTDIDLFDEEQKETDKLLEHDILRNQLYALYLKFTENTDSCAVTYNDILNYIIEEGFKLITYYGNYEGNLSTAINNQFNNKKKQYQTNANIALEKYNTLLMFLVEEQAQQSPIIYIKPIIMTCNRYALSAISGWDGNKLYTGTGNTGDYLYAPQVGAGVKNNDGSFTGIVIGQKKENNKIKVGLFGFGPGKNNAGQSQDGGIETIFLDANTGKATFGQSGKGQIIINPGETSTIAGWDINNTTLKGGNTILNSNGTINCQNLIANTKGEIAGWTIGSSTLKGGQLTLDKSGKIYSGSHSSLDNTTNGFYLSNDGLSIGSKFNVSSNGKFIAKELYANDNGEIAGWTIGSSTLKGGQLTLDKSGKIYSGSHSSLDNTTNGFYLSNDGLSVGSKFKVGSDGVLTTKELYASSGGTIGGWNIGSNKLSSNNIELNANGAIKHTGGNWEINSSGYATFKDVNITSGSGKQSTIGSINIIPSGLQSTNWGAGGGFQILNSGVATFRDINATGGTIGGCKITNGILKIGNANISSLSVDKITAGNKDGYNVQWRAVHYVSDIETRAVGVMKADGSSETVRVVQSYSKELMYVLCGKGGTA